MNDATPSDPFSRAQQLRRRAQDLWERDAELMSQSLRRIADSGRLLTRPMWTASARPAWRRSPPDCTPTPGE